MENSQITVEGGKFLYFCSQRNYILKFKKTVFSSITTDKEKK